MTTDSTADGTRTPSPQGPYSESSLMMGSKGGGVEVPSPVPASISSTTSSEQSHGNNNSSNNGSGGYGVSSVPNPFSTTTSAPPATVAVAPGPSGWGAHAYDTGAGNNTNTSYAHPGSIPMVVSASSMAPAPAPPAYQHPTTHPWARENSCPNFSIGTSEPKSPSSASGRGGAKGVARRRYSSKTSSNSTGSNKDSGDNGGNSGESVNTRRQKRLERNRESARLSRRRRKQYLEILEDRVTQLSTELDQGRRAHAAQAVTITLHKRREVLEAPDKTDEERMRLLDHGLGRNSSEMMLVTTFKYQQLKSFSLPPQSKFIMWLTLQNDQYFRGGRAASERLSAARIGERMLNSGNDRVPPAQSMWPLFCNEVGLSYDQEERVRNFQRTLLQTPESWLERHTARAADLAMTAVHDTSQAMSLRLGQRERSMLNVLTPTQRVKFLTWAEKNREKLHHVMQGKVKKHMENAKNPMIDERFKIEKRQHVAANLYIINHRLQKILQMVPRAAPLVTGTALKKLSRRPSFESLGRSPLDKPGKDGDGQLSREHSFASSGSLKRSASVLSMDGDRPQLLQISPDDAEETCKATVEKTLGYVKEIIPPTPAPQYSSHPQNGEPQAQQQQRHQQQDAGHLRIPSPTQVNSVPYQQPAVQQQYAQQQPQYTQSSFPVSVVSNIPGAPHQEAPGHKKQSSFIPPYLNVVPEEMFPNDGTADEFLMSLVDEDWAIGEGIDMDTSD